MKEHPDIVKFCHFSAYVRTRSAGILRGLTPWHTDFGTKSSVLHLVRGVQAPGTHVRSDYSQTRHIGGRPSSHKANLIPQSKRQDTTIIVIPCLCSFTVPSSPSAELPINKKRTQTLFHKESGSSTNCMVEHQGVEPWHRSPGLSHFESFPPCDFWWKLSEDGSTQRKPKSCGILRILASVFRFYLNPQGFPSSSHFCPEL